MGEISCKRQVRSSGDDVGTLSADALLVTIMEEVRAFVGERVPLGSASQHDDLTVIVLGVRQ